MTKASPAKCAEKPSDPTRGPPFFYGAKGNWRSSPKKLREMDGHGGKGEHNLVGPHCDF
jgi:hypothetical protein